MENKSIVFTKPCVAELITENINDPLANQVQVKLAISTISSGTERANISGEPNVSIYSNSKQAEFPRRSGYSSSGIVQKVGAGVSNFKKGDRVCLSWSTHSQYCNMDSDSLFKINNDNITFEQAALFHIGTFPMAAIRKCKVEMGESAIVMGQGVLGMIAVKMLKLSGAVPIIAVDPVKEKREISLSYGADFALDPNEVGFAEKVRKLTNGGAKVAIEVTGFGSALNQVLDCMSKFGRVALLGCTRKSDFTVDYYHKVHGPGITLIGAHTNARPLCESYPGYWTLKDDIMAQQRLTEYGRLSLSDMVEETHSPEEAPQIYDRLVKEKSFPLVQFDWRKI